MKKKIAKIHVKLEVKMESGRVVRPRIAFSSAVITGKKQWSNKKWFEFAIKDLESKVGKLEFISGEVEKEYEKIKNDKSFIDEFNYYLETYVGRPSPLFFAKRISRPKKCSAEKVCSQKHFRTIFSTKNLICRKKFLYKKKIGRKNFCTKIFQ